MSSLCVPQPAPLMTTMSPSLSASSTSTSSSTTPLSSPTTTFNFKALQIGQTPRLTSPLQTSTAPDAATTTTPTTRATTTTIATATGLNCNQQHDQDKEDQSYFAKHTNDKDTVSPIPTPLTLNLPDLEKVPRLPTTVAVVVEAETDNSTAVAPAHVSSPAIMSIVHGDSLDCFAGSSLSSSNNASRPLSAGAPSLEQTPSSSSLPASLSSPTRAQSLPSSSCQPLPCPGSLRRTASTPLSVQTMQQSEWSWMRQQKSHLMTDLANHVQDPAVAKELGQMAALAKHAWYPAGYYYDREQALFDLESKKEEQETSEAKDNEDEFHPVALSAERTYSPTSMSEIVMDKDGSHPHKDSKELLSKEKSIMLSEYNNAQPTTPATIDTVMTAESQTAIPSAASTPTTPTTAHVSIPYTSSLLSTSPSSSSSSPVRPSSGSRSHSWHTGSAGSGGSLNLPRRGVRLQKKPVLTAETFVAGGGTSSTNATITTNRNPYGGKTEPTVVTTRDPFSIHHQEGHVPATSASAPTSPVPMASTGFWDPRRRQQFQQQSRPAIPDHYAHYYNAAMQVTQPMPTPSTAARSCSISSSFSDSSSSPSSSPLSSPNSSPSSSPLSKTPLSPSTLQSESSVTRNNTNSNAESGPLSPTVESPTVPKKTTLQTLYPLHFHHAPRQQQQQQPQKQPQPQEWRHPQRAPPRPVAPLLTLPGTDDYNKKKQKEKEDKEQQQQQHMRKEVKRCGVKEELDQMVTWTSRRPSIPCGSPVLVSSLSSQSFASLATTPSKDVTTSSKPTTTTATTSSSCPTFGGKVISSSESASTASSSSRTMRSGSLDSGKKSVRFCEQPPAIGYTYRQEEYCRKPKDYSLEPMEFTPFYKMVN